MLSLLQKWLLFRFVFIGDERAWRRLKALSRLRVRRELKEMRALVHDLGALGLDPAPVVAARIQAKLAQLQEALR